MGLLEGGFRILVAGCATKLLALTSVNTKQKDSNKNKKHAQLSVFLLPTSKMVHVEPGEAST